MGQDVSDKSNIMGQVLEERDRIKMVPWDRIRCKETGWNMSKVIIQNRTGRWDKKR